MVLRPDLNPSHTRAPADHSLQNIGAPLRRACILCEWIVQLRSRQAMQRRSLSAHVARLSVSFVLTLCIDDLRCVLATFF